MEAPDRMAQLRDQIAALEAEYAELRARVIAGYAPTSGRDWVASVSRRTSRHIPVESAQQMLPADLFDALVKVKEQTFVTLHRRKQNNEQCEEQ